MTLLIIIIILALAFDFINGFHDAANSIATVVTTKVLSPLQAVLWAAAFNFIAFFIAKYIIGEFGIANTVAKTVIEQYITLPIVLSGLVAAIMWNLFTWWFGIPSSSSHTLIGGFAGAAIAANGFQTIHGSTILLIASFIVLAPLIGMIGGNVITLLTMHLVKKIKPSKAEKWFKRLQLISSAALSIGHGLNDSQKVMGIIAITLISVQGEMDLPYWMQLNDFSQFKSRDTFDWIPFACFTVIGIGTLSGGWKIIKTMGNKITKITCFEGFCAQTSAALTLFLTEILKVPVSTTHVITGSIMGVGATKRLSAVRWGVTRQLLTAWLLTIPVSALLAAGTYGIVKLLT
ncbi:MAG: inorganic phosphate transporter [Bacteroidales bacterium]|jgi:PiT family inorganic phosphate transporter|nr:inorganic phosphate transporter [Bacteroidales bacterium]